MVPASYLENNFINHEKIKTNTLKSHLPTKGKFIMFVIKIKMFKLS